MKIANLAKLSLRLALLSLFPLWIGQASAQIPPLALPQVDVVFLTADGSHLLKSWFPSDFKALGSKLTAQKLFFEDSAGSLSVDRRAEIDLVTLHGLTSDGKPKMVRIPRFMIWRGFIRLFWNAESQSLRADARSSDRLLVPTSVFAIENIKKVELSQAARTYPGTRLRIRTNPAASRGQKLFTQSCLACHSLPGITPLNPNGLTPKSLDQFEAQHPKIQLDDRARRGLLAYSGALALEQSKVDSQE